MSQEAQRIINDSHLDEEEKALVYQIIENMYARGLIWDGESSDETIATTECIVLTNSLRKLWQERQSEGKQIPCQHEWGEGETSSNGKRLFTCSKCGQMERDD